MPGYFLEGEMTHYNLRRIVFCLGCEYQASAKKNGFHLKSLILICYQPQKPGVRMQLFYFELNKTTFYQR